MSLLQILWSPVGQYGGVESCCAVLSEFIAEAGHGSVILRASGPIKNAIAGREIGLPVLAWDPQSNPLNNAIQFRKALAEVLTARDISVVVSHNMFYQHAPGIWRALNEMCEDTTIRHYIYAHDVADRLSGKDNLRNRGQGSHLLVNSGYNAERLRIWNAGESRVVYPAIRLHAHLRATEGPPRNGIAVLGRWVRKKRIPEILRYVRTWIRTHRTIKWTVYVSSGGGAGADVEEKGRVMDEIRALEEWVPVELCGAGVAPTLEKCSVGIVIFDVDEGFGLMGIEVLAAGASLVAQVAGGANEWVCDANVFQFDGSETTFLTAMEKARSTSSTNLFGLGDRFVSRFDVSHVWRWLREEMET